MSKTVTRSIRIPEALAKKIQALAAKQDRTFNYIASRLLAQAVSLK